MTLVTGEIVDTYDENGITMGKIRVGAIARASTHSTVEG